MVPATKAVPKTISDSKRRTVGIRITSHPIAQALAVGLGRPLLTSSAINPETGEPCRDAEELLEAFGKAVDVVVDAALIDSTSSREPQPSTVIAIDGETVTLIREGQGSLEGILEIEPSQDPSMDAPAQRRSGRR